MVEYTYDETKKKVSGELMLMSKTPD